MNQITRKVGIDYHRNTGDGTPECVLAYELYEIDILKDRKISQRAEKLLNSPDLVRNIFIKLEIFVRLHLILYFLPVIIGNG